MPAKANLKDGNLITGLDPVRASYDRAAEEYARHLFDELRHKPLDCQLLDRLAERVGTSGLVCDVGCGPGQVARYLHNRGLSVCGIDLSLSMLETARRLNPDIEFLTGDICRLDTTDCAYAGIAAFYAIVNLSPAELHLAFEEMYRVLRPSGWLLLSFHIGDEAVHVDDLWGCPVNLDFYFFPTQQVRSFLEAAGFKIEEVIEREPYSPEVEYQSRRAYIFAQKLN